MVKRKLSLLLAVAALTLLPAAAQAQDKATAPLPPPVVVPPPAAPPDLSTLPDADLVLFVNPQKILNEAIPRLVPAKQNDDIHTSLDQLKKTISVDAANINYIVLAVRMRKPAGSDPIPLPEFLLVIKGGVGLGTMAFLQQMAGTDLHTEKYGTHDVLTYTSKDIAKKSEELPIIGSYAEFALTALHDDTYAIGTTNYVHAAIDAAEGRGRLNPEMAQKLVSDPENLISLNGSLLTGVARAIALIGPDKPGKWDCLSSFGHGYAAVRLTPTGLRITGALNGDNPETAGILKNMIVFLIKEVGDLAPDPQIKAALTAMNLSVEGNEVVGSGEISQATINTWLEKQEKPAATPATTPAKDDTQKVTAPAVTTKKRTTTGRRRRRTN